MTTAALTCLAALAACSGPPKDSGTGAGFKLSASTPEARGEIDSFTWAVYAEPPTLDYTAAFDYPQNTILSNVCESLMRWTPGLTMEPGLAKKASNPDPIAYLPYVSRLTRSLVLAERKRPYVSAYQVQGHSALQICLRHILPNIAPVVLAQSTINFGYALMDLAGLSFLGLGIPALTPDWGRMVFDGRTAVQHGYPLSAILPCVFIVLTVVAFNVVGERWADRVARRTP
ncbi:ABC transporter permease subunit [Streptomyces sp. NPDC001966]